MKQLNAFKVKFKILDNEDFTYDDIANALLNNNPVYAVGINNSSLVQILSENLKLKDRVGMFFNENKEHITLHIAKVGFRDKYDEKTIRENRMISVYELFNRWTVAGFNKRKAKNPFGCKGFNEFCNIEKISALEYIVFLAPEKPEEDYLYQLY